MNDFFWSVEQHDANPANRDTIGLAKCMCLAEVEKPRDYTRLTQKSCGNLGNLVVG